MFGRSMALNQYLAWVYVGDVSGVRLICRLICPTVGRRRLLDGWVQRRMTSSVIINHPFPPLHSSRQ
ncbi:unnamed protein product [Angiostrongylus costaricensis]|uniref:Secreted protein n=1 Tax=Angiostrongylus costaricensis TaxID=334426 RepID=A0A0R3PT10_ANGCS|nr:unnamed protein product [Angiostrongylus costaricensis]